VATCETSSSEAQSQQKKLTVVETGSVEGKTEAGLDTGAESLGVAEAEDTGVVDLGLDKGSVVLESSARKHPVESRSNPQGRSWLQPRARHRQW
jgi:hypothetical protein